MNLNRNGKIARLPKRLGRGAWIGGGAEPLGTRGSASRCELREFVLPVPFTVPLNTKDFCFTPEAVLRAGDCRSTGTGG
jgi:hypothetical protein